MIWETSHIIIIIFSVEYFGSLARKTYDKSGQGLTEIPLDIPHDT